MESATRASRPASKSSGPTATVPPRSRMSEAVASALSTPKYVVQDTEVSQSRAMAPMPATSVPFTSARSYGPQREGPGSNSQPSSGP